MFIEGFYNILEVNFTYNKKNKNQATKLTCVLVIIITLRLLYNSRHSWSCVDVKPFKRTYKRFMMIVYLFL